MAEGWRAKIWDPALVRRQARELGTLAAEALTRRKGPVRDPGVTARIERLLRCQGTPENAVKLVAEVVETSLHLTHPRYAAQQVAAPIPLAALVESVVAALNNGLAVWEMSPVATAIDRDLIDGFKKLLGYPAGADGTSVPGGAFANLTALLAARARLSPRSWSWGGGRIAVLAGMQSHYSVSRAIGILGLGTSAIFGIPLDDMHRTDVCEVPGAFRKAWRAGFRKFVLVATCGSTPVGSCDDLPALAKIAHREDAWLHVDAAHGGGIAFSRRYRRLLRGIDRADSIAFDPHKMLFMPLASSTVLFRDGRSLRAAFEQHAPYLFSTAARKFPDLGEVTIACSQRFDSLKTWLTWKAYSDRFWDELTTGVCDVAHAAYEYCERSPVLEPAHEPQLNILCFRLRRRPRRGRSSDALHWRIKETVNASGRAYISSTVLQGRRVFRIAVMNPRTDVGDIREVLAEVEKAARLLAG